MKKNILQNAGQDYNLVFLYTDLLYFVLVFRHLTSIILPQKEHFDEEC